LNTIGHLFRVTTFGESHGPAIGCVIDGCPPGIAIAPNDFQEDLERRATGRTRHTSQRKEADQVEILSGVFEGHTTGTPICLVIRNTDQKSTDYSDIKDSFRPGHADITYQEKYGVRDYRGGGRSSARTTAAVVMAAVIAKRYLHAQFATLVRACLVQCGPFKALASDAVENIDWQAVESTPLFWPNLAQLPELEAYLDGLRKSGDSVGGQVMVVASNMPKSLGEPLFGKLDGDLAAALMGINAVKAVEIGDGVAVCTQRGSEHRDQMTLSAQEVSPIRRHGRQVESYQFETNHAGGVLGGISTGQDLVARVSIKPTSSILIPGWSVRKVDQKLSESGYEAIDIVTRGRHDPCVAIRAPAIVEAMTALVLMDHVLRQRAQNVRSD
jgi:chorismate synthase